MKKNQVFWIGIFFEFNLLTAGQLIFNNGLFNFKRALL